MRCDSCLHKNVCRKYNRKNASIDTLNACQDYIHEVPPSSAVDRDPRCASCPWRFTCTSTCDIVLRSYT